MSTKSVTFRQSDGQLNREKQDGVISVKSSAWRHKMICKCGICIQISFCNNYCIVKCTSSLREIIFESNFQFIPRVEFLEIFRISFITM